MPRQIIVTITEEQQQACWAIAQKRVEPTTWQEVAREAIDAGLPKLNQRKKKAQV